jgi:predicted nucleic acid-binding Zn ribbon protein
MLLVCFRAYGMLRVVCSQSCGMLSIVWYALNRVVCSQSCGMLSIVWYALNRNVLSVCFRAYGVLPLPPFLDVVPDG